MREVAIIGAGQLGGALAHELALRNDVESVRLVDRAGRTAQGKALDIAQAAPIEGFATDVSGTPDIIAAAGADLVVVADQAGASEWEGDEALLLVRQIHEIAPRAIVLAAGASHRELVERGVRELHLPRHRLFGSAPEALIAGARAVVALELNVSPRDVSLTVFGIPARQTVVGWEHATVGGSPVGRFFDEPARRRAAARIVALWPPGPLALAAAARKVIAVIAGRSNQLACCFVAPDDSSGRRARTAALPVRLGAPGILEVMDPALSAVERVAFDNAVIL